MILIYQIKENGSVKERDEIILVKNKILKEDQENYAKKEEEEEQKETISNYSIISGIAFSFTYTLPS